MRQTQECHGRRIAEIRNKLGWTQTDLARQAGYSERLIRKAESGAMVTSYAIKDIAAALSRAGQLILLDDLICNPLQLAKQFLKKFASHESEMAAELTQMIAPEFVFNCAGNQETTPFAGQWHGLKGLEQWARKYFGVLVRPQKDFYQPELLVSDKTVIAWGQDWVHTPSCSAPPIWVTLKFDFVKGKLTRLEKQFDTDSMKNILAATPSRQLQPVSMG